VAHTGNASVYGLDQELGAQLAADWYNANGGINGRPVELVYQDAGTDEQAAINAFNTLIGTNVVAIIGPTLSQQAFAADPAADQAAIPVIGPSNTAKGIPQIGDYVARVSAPVTVIAPNSIKAALQLNPNIKTVDVLYAKNDAFSVSETAVFQGILKDLGLTVPNVLEFQTTDTSFTNQTTTVLTDNPELVVISGLATDSGTLVKELRDLGYTGLIVGGNGLNSPNMFPICQAACDGIIVTQAYSVLNDSDVNKTFIAAYQAKQGGKNPGQFPAQAFSAVQVVVEAMRALGDTSGMSIADVRTKLNTQILAGTYDTPIGPISFDPEGEIIQQAYYVAQIKMSADGSSGDFTLLTKVEAEPAATAEATMAATAEATP
jgi:branched-chain amino acid transport system substrate-binding protein